MPKRKHFFSSGGLPLLIPIPFNCDNKSRGRGFPKQTFAWFHHSEKVAQHKIMSSRSHQWFCSADGDNCLGSFHVGCEVRKVSTFALSTVYHYCCIAVLHHVKRTSAGGLVHSRQWSFQPSLLCSSPHLACLGRHCLLCDHDLEELLNCCICMKI